VKFNKSVDGGFLMSCYVEGTTMQIVPRGMCIGRNVTLWTLVGYAYNIDAFLTSDGISGGPGWVTTDRFYIQTKAENPLATEAELRRMLQTLLADRFKLVVHEDLVYLERRRFEDGCSSQATRGLETEGLCSLTLRGSGDLAEMNGSSESPSE
jgi:hypothetical protein